MVLGGTIEVPADEDPTTRCSIKRRGNCGCRISRRYDCGTTGLLPDLELSFSDSFEGTEVLSLSDIKRICKTDLGIVSRCCLAKHEQAISCQRDTENWPEITKKYEEICAPSLEEFCFIIDNTYKRDEVLRMESQVLNFLDFQLSTPTTKKFLRFVQAAQTCYKAPRIELEFLANYLAELTLPEYGFLKFLPSLIAASAVFLARWMLDQSNQPWNPTLEHYTNYKVSDLKPVVFGLQLLHLNTMDSPLKVVREKYKQPKFKGVASLSLPAPLDSANSVLSLWFLVPHRVAFCLWLLLKQCWPIQRSAKRLVKAAL
ncbi:hypothetical protein POM88_006049 [Heracleum sosnowskyi]|uniref:B-like cyclin n=1 Tax=Heracleum sosnowskyi TaxID=360622 RepID=A0AAD8J2Q4_9APIA|nr:hypothetical protein POM88_006049 [Heracleum sosnowskyi]